MRRLSRTILALAAMLLLVPMPALAQSDEAVIQRAEDVVSVLKGEMAYEEVFHETFVNAVPEARFVSINTQMEAQLGPLVGLEAVEHSGNPGEATISLRFEQAIASGPMRLAGEDPHRIAGLLLNAIEPINEDGLTALEQIQALPGTTNILFARLDGSQVLAEHNAEGQLALGSTFKLYVLSALSQSIARGERDWSDVVELSERSFPSGVMQNWPEGSPVTLHTLALQMISISDNTATDQLMAVLGRDAVEAEVAASGHSDPSATFPFMNTREMFLLKLSQDEALADYAAASADVRRASLEALEDRELDMSQISSVFSGGPRFIEVEWFASPRDIARVYARLAADPVAREILAVNKGMPDTHFSGWDYVGYKGGSEPGVLNFSWLLRDEDGDFWVLTMGWSNPEETVSEIRFLGLAQQALREARTSFAR